MMRARWNGRCVRNGVRTDHDCVIRRHGVARLPTDRCHGRQGRDAGHVILDGYLVPEGESYQEVKVVEIRDNGAVLAFDGNQRWYSSGSAHGSLENNLPAMQPPLTTAAPPPLPAPFIAMQSTSASPFCQAHPQSRGELAMHGLRSLLLLLLREHAPGGQCNVSPVPGVQRPGGVVGPGPVQALVL